MIGKERGHADAGTIASASAVVTARNVVTTFRGLLAAGTVAGCLAASASVAWDEDIPWKFEGTTARSAAGSSAVASTTAIDTRDVQCAFGTCPVLLTTRAGFVINLR